MKSSEQQTNGAVLDRTESVCPECLRVIGAQVVVRDRAVFMEKTCPEHGAFSTYLWPDVDHYQWMKSFRFPCLAPKSPQPPSQGCPEDCGPCASHLRRQTLVEIEVTQHCNLRCPVCFMSAESAPATTPPDPDRAYFAALYQTILDKTGPQTSIQLTGGEPTFRADLPEIIRIGREIGFEAIEVNTNGVVIAEKPEFAVKLAEAGASGIYLQFDGLTTQVYEQTRGKNLLAVKLKAIENCRAAGLQVVLAMTVIAGVNQDQMGDVLRFAVQNRDVIAGIAYQPAFGSGRFEVNAQRRLTLGDVAFLLAEQSGNILDVYDFWPLGCSHSLCDAATYLIERDGKLAPLTRSLSAGEYHRYFNPDSPQGSVFPDIAAQLYPELGPGLSIVIMNYMDCMSMDLKRLRECSMTVASPDGRIVPFCGYQLTDIRGEKKSGNHRSGEKACQKSKTCERTAGSADINAV